MKEDQIICPVMKIPADKEFAEKMGWVREYKGKKYYFCCDSCPAEFDKNPNKYITEDSSENKVG
ncbi:MAG: YHS domain-containing protein [Candidatus Harrisonbacteria bacterium]|nr:YHS domain-containing protein [Candidatus Harrisonbacteria bacterium]